MSLSERLVKASTQGKPQQRCKLGALLVDETLPENDRKTLAQILEVPQGAPNYVTNAALVRILHEEDHPISDSVANRHRRGDCPCYRKAGA